MNRFFRCVCGIATAFLLVACGDKNDRDPATGQGSAKQSAPEKASRTDFGEELGVLMTRFGVTVKSVSDRPTWEPAKQELARIEARTVAITAELKSLPHPTPREITVWKQVMNENEDNLGKALGDKTAFMQRLPADVSRELAQAAGSFSRQMGIAQQALYGNATQ